MANRLTTAPTTEPVSLAEFKSHIGFDATDTSKDTEFTQKLKEAREDCEIETNRAFITQTWTLTLPRFPAGEIRLPTAPLQSITSISYVDENGDNQTLDAGQYQVDAASEPGRVAPARLCNWPSTDSESFNAVTIIYVAGWTAAANVPNGIKAAIKVWAASKDDSPAGSDVPLPESVKRMLAHHMSY